MGDIEAIRTDVSRIQGVSDVRAGQLRDGRATFAVRYAGTGATLAADLARLGSGLKDVTGFDDMSVQVAWGGAPAVSALAPTASTPPAGAAPDRPAEASAADGEPAATAPATDVAPVARPDPSKVAKDPLAYKVHQLAGGTVATFDGWKIAPLPLEGGWAGMETHPDGKENDFQLLVTAGIPDAQIQANLFEEGARFLQQMIPLMRPSGEPAKTTIGGDEARVQDYALAIQGTAVKVQSLIIKKKDVAVALLAFGTDDAWKTYGRSVMITAQSITIKESPPDPALVGTWTFDSYRSSGTGTSSQFSHSSSRSITVYPNSTFTDSSFSSTNLSETTGSTSAYLEGGDRGRVVKRGTVLSFHYDNGKVWSPEYRLDGGALVLNGTYWFRQ
jgi:hypothetical protein